jgi:hypothetical protein
MCVSIADEVLPTARMAQDGMPAGWDAVSTSRKL